MKNLARTYLLVMAAFIAILSNGYKSPVLALPPQQVRDHLLEPKNRFQFPPPFCWASPLFQSSIDNFFNEFTANIAAKDSNKFVRLTDPAITNGYDAGTEINTEDFADIVPPCQSLIGVSSGDPGTGTSDPALAEGGFIMQHPGILGGDDLIPEIHGWIDPVAVVEITRTN